MPGSRHSTLILIAQRLYYNHSPESKFYGLIYLVNLLGSLIFIPSHHVPNPYRPCFWLDFIYSDSFKPDASSFQSNFNKKRSRIQLHVRSYNRFCSRNRTLHSLALGLPMQTILSAARGLVYFAIFSMLFLLFKKAS